MPTSADTIFHRSAKTTQPAVRLSMKSVIVTVNCCTCSRKFLNLISTCCSQVIFHAVPRRERGEITPTKVTHSQATDKDLSTIVAIGANRFIQFEFDKPHFINTVIIYYWFYTDWIDPDTTFNCPKSENQFKYCVDNDNNVDVSVYQGVVKVKSCGTLQLTYGLKQSDQIYRLVCNAEGDTVKFSKSTHGVIAVFEVVFVSFSFSDVEGRSRGYYAFTIYYLLFTIYYLMLKSLPSTWRMIPVYLYGREALTSCRVRVSPRQQTTLPQSPGLIEPMCRTELKEPIFNFV